MKSPSKDLVLKSIPFSPASLQEHAAGILSAADSRRTGTVRLVNFNTIANMQSDLEYRQVVAGPGINIVDSTPLAWILNIRFFGERRVRSTRGPDLFRTVLRDGRAQNTTHFLLGSTPDTLGKLATKIELDYPGCKIVGQHSPPFRKLTDQEVDHQDELIKQLQPQIIWVGLGGKLQDFEAQRISRTVPGLCIGIGAAFDFISGTKPEAPSILQHSGMEWLYRMLTEPKRLVPRYARQVTAGLRWLATRS